MSSRRCVALCTKVIEAGTDVEMQIRFFKVITVDASQGVEAQTVANVYLALENDLEIIPVLNKIDLPGAEPERVCREIEDVLGLDTSQAVQASAKANIGMEDILEQIVELVPPPPDTADQPLRALIFDSYFDPYRGGVCVFRVVDGTIRVGDQVKGRVLHARYSRYMQRIAEEDPELVSELAKEGSRFTHHTSIAPTGTISLSLANNASNGIEPTFAHS